MHLNSSVNMTSNKVLIIIEELGEITTSAAIVNWNLSKIICDNYKSVDLLTLDNVSKDLIAQLPNNRVFTHPKNNLSSLQRILLKIPKLRGLIQIFLGKDFQHYNRVRNIKKFIRLNNDKYKSIIALSGGAGFSPHFAISGMETTAKTIGVIHDPYPKYLYPKEFRGSSKIKDFFKIQFFQKSLNKMDHLVFPSLKLYEWIYKDYLIDCSKTSIIPHAVSFEKFANNKMVNKSSTIITHTGTLLKPRDPSVFINSFLSLKNKDNLSLEFHGAIENKLLTKLKKNYFNKSILINPNRISYNKALAKLHNSSFLLLIESNSRENPFLPTKFVDYINVGKPIIALTTSGSEVYRLLGEDYPFMCELNDSTKIIEILEDKIYNKNDIKKSFIKITELKVYFSKDYIKSEYKKIINI